MKAIALRDEVGRGLPVPRDLPALRPDHESAEDAAIAAILQRYGAAVTE
ncbi:hypothetical protein [Microbacterium lacticum]